MSRSSKGFADFFPTAPSVLQQKRSKASQDRRAHRSSSPGNSKYSHSVHAPATLANGGLGGSVPAAGLANGEVTKMSRSLTREDSECVNGDIVHEVGSASSTSTASSIFSAGQKEANMVHSNGPHKSTSLTPLTNIDSSPRANGMKSSPKRSLQDQHLLSTTVLKSPPSPQLSDANRLGSSPSLHLRRPLARPGKGEPKGFKAVYDPDLDKTSRAKEKKSRLPVHYQPFGEEVSSPPVPRQRSFISCS